MRKIARCKFYPSVFLWRVSETSDAEEANFERKEPCETLRSRNIVRWCDHDPKPN